MEPFKVVTGTAVPVRADNIDTDQIIPARYLTTVTREGLGEGLFADYRRSSNGELRPDFPLNQPEYAGATIMLAGKNFGCGSSREHAAWAITDAGFKVVISSDFADIFYNNALKNGLVPIVLPAKVMSQLFELVEADPSVQFTVDLKRQVVETASGSSRSGSRESHHFEIDPFRKLCLLEGLDDLGYLMSKVEQIDAFEQRRENFRAAA